MRVWRNTLIFAGILSLLTFLRIGSRPTLAQAPPVTSAKADLRRFHIRADCPLVYDNDWLGDTPDDDYLFVRASQGTADLRGLILSKDEWNAGKHYKVEDGLNDFRANITAARAAGLRRIPEVTVGVDCLLTQPPSGKIEDTKPIASAGTDLIVREARRASPQKPLLVFVGGPLVTVACAYLTDPAIAERMVVLMTDIDGYNGSDRWANYIVATRCKLINFGTSRLWWPQRPQTPMMPLNRMSALPQNPLTAQLNVLARQFWERSTRKEKPDRDDGLADGATVFLAFLPESWKGVTKVRVTGVWSHEDVASGTYHYLDASAVDFDGMREEFFRVVGTRSSYNEKLD